ncbi:MAG TPA: DUF1214 domain-containing protein [Rhizomicrobium sp.]|nr:DUF1214 domain-containing protein [Rhizomicrobium sp.]
MVMLGALLGLGATWLAVFHATMPGGIADGPWRSNLDIGSTGGDALTRARVALHGLLALNRGETVYYTAASDDAGARLDGACTYRISGRDPAARWWSITAYGADDYLIPNPAHRYSVSKNSVTRDAGGTFAATVSPRAAPGDWIATVRGRYTLTLRLYNPAPSVAADPSHAALPRIEKVGC